MTRRNEAGAAIPGRVPGLCALALTKPGGLIETCRLGGERGRHLSLFLVSAKSENRGFHFGVRPTNDVRALIESIAGKG